MPIYKQKGTKNGLAKYKVVVNYTDRNGEYKRAFRTVYGLSEAKEAEAELRKEVGEASSGPERITVSELIDECLAAKASTIRATSLDKSRRILAAHVTPILGAIRLDRLSVKDLEHWRSETEALDLKFSTKNNAYRELASVFNWAVRTQRIAANPLRAIARFSDPDTNDDDDAEDKLIYYTPDEYLRYSSAAKAAAESSGDWRYFVFFSVAFYTGARKGEINALRWSDYKDGVISIRRSIAQKLTTGDVETAPKNKSSRRKLIVPDPLAAILDDQRKRQELSPDFSEDWRICGGREVLRDTSIENKNKEYSAAAGIKHITIHQFRHTHATILCNEGVMIEEIARRLGHSTPAITWKIYAHLYPSEENRAVSIFNKIF